jgi:NADH-quinone oxidoreductase subunit N
VHATDWLALLPLMVLAAAALVVLVAIAVRRHHLATLLLTLGGLLGAGATLPLAATVAPHRIAPLLVFDRFSLFYVALLLSASLVVAVLSYGYLIGRDGPCEEFYLLLLLCTLGALVLVMSQHFWA